MTKRKFHFSYFSFHFRYCQFICKPAWTSRLRSTYNNSNVLLVGILKEIMREWKPLNNFLFVQEDLFLAPKYLMLSSTKILGHLLNKQAMLEVVQLIVLIIGTFLLCLGINSDKMIQMKLFPFTESLLIFFRYIKSISVHLSCMREYSH